mmetsp:Transcript_39832/g.95591  ORF Transcript_39832/g.95591 Transcript_39832/m.95591 type:complete len:219 (-) Transcript_39832:97-753(-)
MAVINSLRYAASFPAVAEMALMCCRTRPPKSYFEQQKRQQAEAPPEHLQLLADEIARQITTAGGLVPIPQLLKATWEALSDEGEEAHPSEQHFVGLLQRFPERFVLERGCARLKKSRSARKKRGAKRSAERDSGGAAMLLDLALGMISAAGGSIEARELYTRLQSGVEEDLAGEQQHQRLESFLQFLSGFPKVVSVSEEVGGRRLVRSLQSADPAPAG